MMDVFMLAGTIAINAAAAHKAIDGTTQKAENASKNIGKAFEKIGSAAVKCGKVIATGMAAGTAALGALLKNSIGEYAEYEQLVGGVETLFQDSQDKVMAYAKEAYKTAGLSANEYMSTVTSFSASLLQGLGGDTEAAAIMADKAITDMADNANKMGTSMSSIQDAYQGFAKQNYTMLDNLKLGYGGTQEEMARLVNESGVLGAAIKVDAKTINSVSFDKIIEAIHIIQERMGITGTTAEEASETISGSFASFKATWRNLMTGLADGKSDIGALLANTLNAGETVWQNIKKVLPAVKGNILIALTELGGYLDEKIRDVVWPKLQEFFKVKFGFELPDLTEIENAVTAWWNNGESAYQKIKDICKWTFGAFVDPEEESWVGSVQSWWTNTAQPKVTSIVQWTFGELVLPAWIDMIDSVSNWWKNDFKPGLVETTEWFVNPKFPSWDQIEEEVTRWWSTIKEKLSALCTFYGTYEINRTYSKAELDAAGEWTIDTTAGATTPVKVGSDANGLYRVPYDGYLTRLHKDEAVLNRLDAREWRTANAYGGFAADNSRLEAMMGNMVSLMQQMVANAGAGQNIVLDSGVLVGQLAPQMDMRLGTISGRKGRGN